MSPSAFTTLLLLFLTLFTHQSTSDSYRPTAFRKRLHLASGVTASERTANGELLYTHCRDDEAPSMLRRDIRCVVHLESSTFEPLKVCNVSLRAAKDGAIVDRRKALHHFGTTKALLVWLERPKSQHPSPSAYHVKITIINLDDCTSSVVEVAYDGDVHSGLVENAMGKHVLAYDDDTFDVVYQNAESCGDRYCKVTFDSRGNRVRGPVSWLPISYRLFFMVPVVPQSSKLGHLAAFFINEGFNMTLVNEDGLTQLSQYPRHDNIGFSYSNTQSLIGFCHHNLNLHSNCTQYNRDGSVKLRTSFEQHRNYFAAAMYNLANNNDGGFLLVTAGCTPGDLDCLPGNPDYFILRIAGDGRMMREIEFTGFECDRQRQLRPISQFFERDDKVCLNLGCYEQREPEDGIVTGRVHAVGKCFLIEDFVD